MCPVGDGRFSTTSSYSNGTRRKELRDDQCVYTLGQHAQYLQLASEVVAQSGNRYWFCDWTRNFVSLSHQNRLMKNIVKEYCQPVRQDDLEDQYVGTATLSPMRREPPAVRTVTIRLRPDCDHIKVYGALNEAFAVLHPKHHSLLKNADNCFQAIGADGNAPLLLSAQLVTSKDLSRLERCLLLRFYHVDQVHLFEEELKKIGGVRNKMKALNEMQTPLNNKLGEACAMLQNLSRKPELTRILGDEQEKLVSDARKRRRRRSDRMTSTNGKESSVLHDIPSPKNSTRESTRYFMENLTPSPSVKDENFEKLAVFPSLSDKDYDVLQETWPLLDRIWSELELAKCTFNTLVDETSRFGMRPCQPSLDKDFCIQLFQVSQQRMLEDLRDELDKSEENVHESLGDYSEFEQQLTHILMRTYNVPLDPNHHNPFNRRDHTSDSLDVGQTPVSLPQRNIGEFPWEFDKVKLALEDVTHTIACVCMEQDYDPIAHSLDVCERSVEHVFSTVEEANNSDLQDFLTKRNRQALVRITQQKLYLKDLVQNKLSYAPRVWGNLPKLEEAVLRWQEISSQASNKDEARVGSNWGGNSGGGGVKKAFEIPLLEFSTKFGTVCVTQNTLVLLSEMPFFESVKAFEINKVELVATPNHPLHKIGVMRHGKRLLGLSPTSMDPNGVVKFVTVLKSLQK
mmetsp:Transcript_31871/g.74992  ORF Transcript_31871/g.74992 Transcript_31871/m.74992 type:complete len:683 (+) Transcript_31871:216-2264(+)